MQNVCFIIFVMFIGKLTGAPHRISFPFPCATSLLFKLIWSFSRLYIHRSTSAQRWRYCSSEKFAFQIKKTYPDDYFFSDLSALMYCSCLNVIVLMCPPRPRKCVVPVLCLSWIIFIQSVLFVLLLLNTYSVFHWIIIEMKAHYAILELYICFMK